MGTLQSKVRIRLDHCREQEFALVYIVAYVAAVYLWSRERSMRRLARECITAGAATVGILGVGALAVMLGFDTLFEQFHLLSFSNDFWQLNPNTDHLIQIFPPAFWESIVFFIGTLIVAEAVLLALGSLIYIGAGRHQAARRMKLSLATG